MAQKVKGHEFLEYVDDVEYGVYAYVNAKGKVVYIGMDKHIDEDRRHKEHNKPSKQITKEVPINGKTIVRQPQLINVKLAEEELTYMVLATSINKQVCYDLETLLINKYKPIYNEKYQGSTNYRKKEENED